ncbi:MAG: hypothetical protein Q8K54_11755 [Gallionella sp.]|nr:hypothetical protein [Gallionella sp.]
MNDAISAPVFRPGDIQQAICRNCGGIVRIHVPDFRSREIRLWWPIPLALIIWLAIIWKFGYFLSSPRVEMAAPAPIEASFVELPEVAPTLPAKSPEAQSKSLPKAARPPRITPRPDASRRTDIAATKPVTQADPAPEPNPAPPADLMAYINAARERHRAAEMSAEREYAEARAKERGPSADEIRMAKIMRNLQPQGTNGVFQIISVGDRSARYSFRGWTKDASSARREVIEVDAGPNGDVEREIVRSMIALIRRYYKDFFNWESQRLERVVVLSARMEDNAGLEDFLIREFFGAGTGHHGLASR